MNADEVNADEVNADEWVGAATGRGPTVQAVDLAAAITAAITDAHAERDHVAAVATGTQSPVAVVPQEQSRSSFA